MRQFQSFFLMVLVLGTAGIAQTPSHWTAVQRADGGASGLMRSIFVPPKSGAPFTLTLDTDWSRPLNGGGTFTVTNERHIVRDSKGRIYQERWGLVPKNGKKQSHMYVFQITDPEQHTLFNCIPGTKVCELYRYRLGTKNKFEPPVGKSGPLPDGSGFRQHEDLGVNNTEGIDTHGYRETTTFNPGAMGNDQPMVMMREFWYSAYLGINLTSIVDEPQTGKQVFTAKEISTAEPDSAFFQIPSGYKIVDRRDKKD